MSVDEADRNARHAARMQRKKAVVDEKIAQATQDKGLILLLTGNGKGKSSSGFGMVARALGHGMRVGIVQFIKGATRPSPMEGRTSEASRASLSARAPRLDPIGEGSYSTGEEMFFRRFEEIRPCISPCGRTECAQFCSRQNCPEVEYHVMGEGFTWETQDRERDTQATRAAWEKARGLLRNPTIHLVLLDELNIVLKYGYLSPTEVIEALQNKPPMQHVIITGRGARPELIEIADTVSEIADVKHAFRAGIRAQKGIEL